MERDLLSRVTGDGARRRLQGQDPRPPPSPTPTLSLRVGTERERQSRAADYTNRGHGHEPQQAQSSSAAADIAALLPSTSRLPFAPDGRLASASVVVPGCPMSERRHNLRAAGAGAPRAQAARMPVQDQRQRASPAGPGPGSAPQRPPTAPVVGRALELAVAGPTVTTGSERCDACGLSARLLQGLSSELDRARAQVALLTCQNESLRHRLKRAAASSSAAGPECPAAASSARAHLDLRCAACRVRPATVLLVPREHLCLCGHCSNSSRDRAAVACPVCRGAVGTWPTEAAHR